VEALIWTASKLGVPTPMLRSAVRINRRQPRLAVAKLQSLIGPLEGARVAVWGLAFKPNSDDVRESPALALVRLLLEEGCEVRAFDPLAMEATSLHFPEVTYCSDVYDAATGADAIVVATDWADFEEVDLAALRGRVAKPVIVDARNALDARRVEDAGFAYTGIGRPTRSKKLANNGHREVPLPPHGRKRKAAAKGANELATYASRE
jgi:UDPglucose 6-dehydrogenase